MPYLACPFDDFPGIPAPGPRGPEYARRQVVAYAHIIVREQLGRPLLTSRCFTSLDITDVTRWVIDEWVLGPEPFAQRGATRPQTPLSDTNCVAAADIASRLARFDEELVNRIDAFDDLRESAVSEDEVIHAAAELAAWVHGEFLRIQPFEMGNLYAAQVAAWWVIRLCGYLTPIDPGMMRVYEQQMMMLRYNAAVEDSLGASDHPDVRMRALFEDQLRRHLLRPRA
jgi:hypothetical protein